MTKEFELEKQRITEWVESAMRHKQALVDLDCNDLGLRLCGEQNNVHIYRGIEKIASYLGLVLTYIPDWNPENRRGRITTMYKGIELYQIWEWGEGNK